MEEVLQTLGVVALVVLVIVGLMAGWIASLIGGARHRLLYMVIGVLAAVATPVLAMVLGIGLLMAGGLFGLVLTAALGAVAVLLIAKMICE